RTALAERAAPALPRMDALTADAPACALMDAIFGNSPFLTWIAEREPEFALDLMWHGPDRMVAQVDAALARTRADAAAGIDPCAPLRVCKRRLALTTAVADITGRWDLARITGCLAAFAEGALQTACRYVLADAAKRGILHRNGGAAEDESGFIIIGMGKLGAFELNYSSDIDIIVFYDPQRMQTAEPQALAQHVNRLTRRLVRVMADRTADGYVFRTDLRLRPDPGSTPPAIAVMGAEAYYETMGQNWERAAMIKARPVAGDLAAGAQFLDHLTPFIWRKNLDFAAIQDIHSIKRQINAHRGGGRIALAGHNIKLGRGGIREIEFFVQTQQLIFGGRLPQLRVRGTLGALYALAEAGKIAAATADELADAYRFLRRLEHRLQMIADEQTHTVPEDPKRLAQVATFLGYVDTAAFERDLLAVLQRVEAHYAELFEDAPALSLGGAKGGNLVFTGSEPDPDTLHSLAELGFTNPKAVDGSVRGWHHGRCRAMRGTRARELLTELMPLLLREIAAQPEPNAAFLAFDRFLQALPAGVQLFSMFYANPDLLRLVVHVLGMAPRLGALLARRSSLLDSVLSRDFFSPPPPLDALEAELNTALARCRYTEEMLDRGRAWANERKFQVGVQSLQGLIDTDAVGIAWTNIAEAALRCFLPAVEAEFAAQHGRIPGCGMAIIGMGKLGGREMTAASDLDLIFVYATPADGAFSDGAKPLAAPQYFARLSQRLIIALTSPTAEGQLYETDMRLRPSGMAGPIAVSLQSFTHYQREEAWTWEQMAITRARPIVGPAPLLEAIAAVLRERLIRRRDPQALVRDIAEMREKMAHEHPTGSIWEVKHVRGGLIDIEFIAQYLQLLHAHQYPGVLSVTTADALDRLAGAGLIDQATHADLREALALWQAVQARLRLTLAGPVHAARGTRAAAPKALRRAVWGLMGLDFEALVDRMSEASARVRAIFAQLIEEPAAASRAAALIPTGGRRVS
ncbi:MAG: bifunctional [glutamine synthetase] adenylyltransferase/[glutamine synthetase]-adenylyl-L-tyrosine phosphorylase, partial [Defluviicoccus sp.]